MRKEIDEHALQNVDMYVHDAAADLSDFERKANVHSMG